MEKTEKVIISASTLITSLLCYSYARAARKEAVPYVMVGAFLGTLIGETLAEHVSGPTNNGKDRSMSATAK
jgi:hypothetical protein